MAATEINRAIPISSVSPKYLHANSTSHTWPFSAIAELIDNAYDPDVSAKNFWIDNTVIKDQDCLIFMDNGKGMDYDKMFKMLSFGFSDKKAVRGHAPVGLYGNGFKSGSMRLGKDAIVFSRKANTMCVGLLSQTYLEKTGAQHVIVPIVMFTKNKETVSAAPEHADSLNDILKYSLFNTKEELLSEFSVIEGLCAGSSGTRIIIWNLHSTPSGELELDFMTDGYDIRIPTDMWKSTTEPNKSQEGSGMSVPKNEYSLRAYCSILYLKPRMQIILQGQKVETLYIPKTLAKVTHDLYKPASFKGAKGIPITFGYNTKSKEHYGLMMYNKNRLIKAYERVACQRKANMGVGVIGVLECNHLTPIHNKQDFDQSVEYRRTIMSVGTKLQDYFKEVNYRHKVNPNCTDSFEDTVKRPDQNWVQCDDCMKWRKLPDGIVPEMLPEKWFCHMNSDPQFRSCEVEEEPDDSDEPARFQKTYKQEEQMQKLQQNRQQPSSSTFSPVQTLPNPSFAIQDTYLSRTPKRKKKAEDLGPENSKEKKARIRDFDDMPDLSTCLPAMFNHDTDANKVDCKDIKASLKYDDDDVIDKDLLKKEKISQTTQSSSDYQQNYKGLHLQIMEAMRHLQDKLIELKKKIKQEGVDTKMDKLEYEQWKNCCDSLQNDLEEIKTENVEVSIQDCAALSTEASVKGEVSQTWKDESQDEKGQTDKIQSLPELRELRQNLTRLLRSHVPTLELEQVINKVFAQVLDAITPKVASLLTKETKLPDADLFLEYKEYKEEDNQSIPPEYLHTRHTSAITDIFVPELINHTANSGEYRFLCSHAGQFHCKLTKIVFEMKGKGEVLYTVESWDNSQLQGMGQFQPAGPLYNIKCSEDSVHYMHFPHCEIYDGTNLIDLAVAHFSEGNVEIIQPLKITNTHVIFEVHGLSIFGLLKKIFWDTPISAQVLLFYKEMIGIQRRKKLHIHLLPGNVAVEEVQKRHQSSTYIPCSSTCQLIPGKKYRPLCEPYASQPKAETFGYDYGPNYHPTFEVIFNTEVEDLALGLLDEIGLEVWEPRQVLLTDEMREGAQDQIDNDVKFVDLHRDMLIQRVSSVNEIADNLLTKRMISNETYSDIGNATTPQEKMRILYRSLNSGGRAVKAEFYKVLMEKEPYLVDDLLPTSTDV